MDLNGAGPVATGHIREPPAVGSLRIELPKPDFELIRPTGDEASSSDETQDISPMQEEEIQSAIGVSISRAQTRLTSPQTPAVEKAAAMEGADSLFDISPEHSVEEPSANCEDAQVTSTNSSQSNSHEPAVSNRDAGTLPSPWRAGPQTFEETHTKYAAKGPTKMLEDLNVRRYISSFSLPLFSRTPSFKDLPVPNLGSILECVRPHPQSQKDSTRRNRASTVITAKSEWASYQPQPNQQRRIGSITFVDSWREQSQLGSDQLDGTHLSKLEQAPGTYPASPSLRRPASDQSLYLRRVTSVATSLGDDTRWENVQEQVNSRVKAIFDSLQDSNIRLPSLPQLPTLASFRPDLKRSRANSSPKSAILAKETNYRANHPFLDKPLPPTPTTKLKITSQTTTQVRFPQLDHALENLTGDIVVLGGYRGSVLRAAKPPHRQLWVPVKVGLNIRKVNLEVGLNPEDEENMAESIYASGMLSHIGPVDMGKRFLKRLQTCENARKGKLRLHNYGYDWRLSPHLLSRQLTTFLENLSCNRPDAPPEEQGATVIAHSMGGLITRHAVNKQPQLFRGVVYAGVPQHCVNILGPLRNGDEVLLSSKVLTAQVNFTLRSSYLLLPDDGYCFINKETKEEYPIDFFDPHNWEDFALSPCIGQIQPKLAEKRGVFGSLSGSLPSLPSLPLPGKKPSESQTNLADKVGKAVELADYDPADAVDPKFSLPSRPPNTDSALPKAEAQAYLKRTLAEVRAFRSELAFNPSHASSNIYPPITLIYANNTPTVCAAQVSSKEAIKRADAYDDLKFASGDGVVLAKAAMLPEGYEAVKGGKVKTERGHVGLLGDLEAVGKCLNALERARRRERVGWGAV